MIRAHVNAIMDQLKQDPILATCTFQGLVTSRPNKYCTVYANSGNREVERFTGGQTEATFSFVIHSVATEPEQVQLVSERVFAQLLGFQPSITGRVSRRVRHIDTQPMQYDADTSPGYFYAVDIFDFTTSPA